LKAHLEVGWILLLAGLLAGAPLSAMGTSAARRARAVAAYERAVELRADLQAKPEKGRQKADYLKVISTFRSVYLASPQYTNTPVALAAVAELYEEMGRCFSDENYFRESIKAYQFLRTEYPQHRLSRDALFAIGEIYRTELNDPEAARQAFTQLLEQQPKSTKVAEAREKLKALDQAEAEREPAPRPAAPAATATQRAEGPFHVTDVRRWVGPNYSRIVIALDGEVKFETLHLANPDRLVFDLQEARLSPALTGKSYPVEDGFLRQIRLGQYSPTVTRVVLDMAEIEDYSVFSLPNPFRLVIDIHGKSKEEVAEKTKPAEPPKAVKPAPEPSRAAAKAESASPASAQGQTSARTTAASSQPTLSASETKGPKVIGSTGAREETAGKATKSIAAPGVKETAEVKMPPAPAGRTSAKASESKPPGEPEAPPAKPAAPTESGARTLTRALGLKIARVAIDPGHGGHDTGCLGPTGLREKDLVLDVGLRLKKLIERNMESTVIMTRSQDVFIPLEERTAVANEHTADLFISVHANASRSRKTRGVETYYLNFTSDSEALEVAARENATSQESVHQLQDLIKKIALTEKIEESHELAKQVQHEVSTRLQQASGEQRDRGIRKAPFVVLIGANMPSILAEISFLTNPRDERLLKKGEYRQKVAEALYAGIARYVDNLGGVVVAQKTRPDDSPPDPSLRSSPAADHSNF
jgi:N-acetylmuramoyl-L-alanine amidase